ncbi:glyoxylate/hydroxypyruvate reductase A [Marinobacterium zhoushanense]|uniref:Glyoxylate/hydroxypyruvate reductase A n=1 Tax=Marinobacterium zhoushanense TaxID=1679163 RepID=A0ABQ1KTW9_9GAMM|nr:glyoxylate/hydroxypyruvate reductase A [Marinobacterium zhoushanense]GGC09176.1 glyoxylate/hydroxypyruvate reductase A [Marinobacterium zhoushanense]
MQIPLIADIDPAEHALWLESLNAALPELEILASAQFSDEQAKVPNFAIVANPAPEELRRFPNLSWVQSLWAGVEKMVGMPELEQIAIVRMQDPELARVMAEAVLAWTLYLHREMPTYARQQQQKVWQQHLYTPPSERSVGVLGIGNLGQEAIHRLRANGFKVCSWSRSAQTIPGVTHYAGIDQLEPMLGQCDILVALLPLTEETRQLINAKRLDQLKPGASLINFARAAIFDYDAMLDRLDSGALKHAVLDVFEQEPLPPTSLLWAHPSITLLPHISGPTDIRSASRIVQQNIRRYLADGDVPEAVDYRRGY